MASLPSAVLMHYKWHPYLLIVMLKILYEMLYLENLPNPVVSALPYTTFTWNMTPVTVVWGGERGTRKHTDKDIFFCLQQYPFCGKRCYYSKEGSLSGCFVYHLEFSLQHIFLIVWLLNAPFSSVFAWSFNICFLGGLLKNQIRTWGVRCVCIQA